MKTNRSRVLAVIIGVLCVLYPSPTFASFDTNLGYGSSGPQVLALQQFLVQQGLLSSSAATGRFLGLTRSALQQFQIRHGIPGVGLFGPLTRIEANKFLNVSISTPATSVGNGASNTVATSLAAQIQQLQAQLAALLKGQGGGSSSGPSPVTVTPVQSTTPAVSGWQPVWLPGTDLKSTSAWTPVNPYGCNAVSFGTTPALGNLFIGRVLDNTDPNNACSGSNWSLTWATMNWATNTITPGQKLLDTSKGPVTLGDGNVITSAYDAMVTVWNNEIWVAFECYGPSSFKYAAASSCVGPLNKDLSLNLSRTAVVVGGAPYSSADSYGYSASVPKLLTFNGNLYLYWSVARYPKSTPNNWTDITSRGVQLGQEQSSLKRVWALASNGSVVGQAIAANDPSTTEVFGLDANDPQSNRTADLAQVITDGKQIYFTAARGGGTCIDPSGTSAGCYRLVIGTASAPLGQDIFNQNLLPSSSLPSNQQSYYRFVYRPTDGRTVLLGGYFYNPQNDPALNAGMKMLKWPDNLLQSAALPSGYASTPSAYVAPVSTPAPVTTTPVVTSTPVTPTTPVTHSSCGSLGVGSALVPGQSVMSCNGTYTLLMQSDGNVVLYKGAIVGTNALWATGTSGKPATQFMMQTDGNLVLYAANYIPLWASSQHSGVLGASTGLMLQDDGNMVIYGTNNTVLWASNTAAAELGT